MILLRLGRTNLPFDAGCDGGHPSIRQSFRRRCQHEFAHHGTPTEVSGGRWRRWVRRSASRLRPALQLLAGSRLASPGGPQRFVRRQPAQKPSTLRRRWPGARVHGSACDPGPVFPSSRVCVPGLACRRPQQSRIADIQIARDVPKSEPSLDRTILDRSFRQRCISTTVWLE